MAPRPVQIDGFPSQRLDEDLHPTAKHVESGLFLDVVVGERARGGGFSIPRAEGSSG